MNKNINLKNFLKFILYSFLGIVLFFIPLNIGGKSTIPLDHIVTYILKIPYFRQVYGFLLIIIGTFLPFYKKTFKVLAEQYSTIGSNNSFRFKYPLTSDGCEQNLTSLYESYHGVSVSLGYEILSKVVSNGKEFESKRAKILVLVPGQGINSKFGRKRVNYQFNLNPKNIQSIKLTDQNLMPKFEIECFLENVNCCVDKPFNGFCNIKECSTQIKSIELQFLRNEKILFKEFEGISEVSEIQNLQIGDGDVIRNLEIPVFMTFPRGFCCATLENKDVCISFEMSLIIVLVNGVVIMENYPVNLWRA